MLLCLSACLYALLLQMCIKHSSHIFLVSSALQYIVLHNFTVLHMFLYYQLHQGIGSVTQCCHLMVRNDDIESLELKKKGFLFPF